MMLMISAAVNSILVGSFAVFVDEYDIPMQYNSTFYGSRNDTLFSGKFVMFC